MNITSILANDESVSALPCMPAMADVLSGTVARPEHYPNAATTDLNAWATWFQSSPAGRRLRELLDSLGVVDALRGDAIWKQFGYLLPGRSPSCGPCQFEFSYLLQAGADGGCCTLVCGAPCQNGFVMNFGANEDGTRLLIWPENVGIGRYTPTRPANRGGW